jgi:hypothetical protein
MKILNPPTRPTVNPRVIPSQLPFDGRVVCPALADAAALEVALPNAITLTPCHRKNIYHS